MSDSVPSSGKYDWDEAFRQCREKHGLPEYYVPRWQRDLIHGEETAEDAQARALAEETGEWLAVAHLDPGHLDGLDDLDLNDDVLDVMGEDDDEDG